MAHVWAWVQVAKGGFVEVEGLVAELEAAVGDAGGAEIISQWAHRKRRLLALLNDKVSL